MRKLLLSVPGFVWWFCVATLFVVLYAASSQASYMPPPLFSWQDKVQHFTFFAVWSLCFHFAISRQEWPASARVRMLVTIAFCALNGAFDEWHQTFTPGRSGNDVFDLMADIAGGCFAAAVGTLLLRTSSARAGSGAVS